MGGSSLDGERSKVVAMSTVVRESAEGEEMPNSEMIQFDVRPLREISSEQALDHLLHIRDRGEGLADSWQNVRVWLVELTGQRAKVIIKQLPNIVVVCRLMVMLENLPSDPNIGSTR